jgi:hypothetical protein
MLHTIHQGVLHRTRRFAINTVRESNRHSVGDRMASSMKKTQTFPRLHFFIWRFPGMLSSAAFFCA